MDGLTVLFALATGVGAGIIIGLAAPYTVGEWLSERQFRVKIAQYRAISESGMPGPWQGGQKRRRREVGEIDFGDIMNRIMQNTHEAGDGEMPAAAGQDRCGDTAKSPTTGEEVVCDRPKGHDGPHAIHDSDDLVKPHQMWTRANELIDQMRADEDDE